MTTGGSPSSTGIYYDASWDDNLSPPGSNCSTRGTAVTYKENINFTADVCVGVRTSTPRRCRAIPTTVARRSIRTRT